MITRHIHRFWTVTVQTQFKTMTRVISVDVIRNSWSLAAAEIDFVLSCASFVINVLSKTVF